MRPRKWTEPAIKQAFDNFIKQHDRLPTKQEMYEKYNGQFPWPLSARITLGITLDEYIQKNYTIYYKRKKLGVYGIMPEEYWIEDFKSQYIKYNYPIETTYNKLRNKETPCTQTIAKMIGVTTWNDVLKYCGLQKEEKKSDLIGGIEFEETLENYEKLNDILQSFIKNLK